MIEPEGVIKYQLNHIDKPTGCEPQIIEQLNAWRTILFQLNLVGQDTNRYGGLGFGNISHRHGSSNEFLITGTQTGHLRQLNSKQYCLVLDVDLDQNSIFSQGLCQPSSEALTHASIYQNQPSCQCVLHIHNPEIWRHSQQLALAQTSVDTAYGTPGMALEVAELFDSGVLDKLPLFTMPGHQDGAVAFGATLEQTGLLLIKYLALAMIIEQRTE
jgi:hypothetical protein